MRETPHPGSQPPAPAYDRLLAAARAALAADRPLTYTEIAGCAEAVLDPGCDPAVLTRVVDSAFTLTSEQAPDLDLDRSGDGERMSALRFSHIIQAAACHPRLPSSLCASMLDRLGTFEDARSGVFFIHRASMVAAALRNPACPDDVLMRAVLTGPDLIRSAALDNPHCPEEVRVAYALAAPG